jgi:hypothetical protein
MALELFKPFIYNKLSKFTDWPHGQGRQAHG